MPNEGGLEDQPAEWKAGVDCVNEAKEWVEAIQTSRDQYQRLATSAQRATDEDRFQAEQEAEDAEEVMNKILMTHNEKVQTLRKLWLGEDIT